VGVSVLTGWFSELVALDNPVQAEKMAFQSFVQGAPESPGELGFLGAVDGVAERTG